MFDTFCNHFFQNSSFEGEECILMSRCFKNVSKNSVLTRFLDNCPLLREVCKFVSNSIKKSRVKTCFVTLAYQKVFKKAQRPKRRHGSHVKNVKKCEKAYQKQLPDLPEALGSLPKSCGIWLPKTKRKNGLDVSKSVKIYWKY